MLKIHPTVNTASCNTNCSTLNNRISNVCICLTAHFRRRHNTSNQTQLLQTFKRALKTELFRRSYDNAHYRQQQHWH